MKAAICACLFFVACKSESKSAPSSAADDKPTAVESAAKQAPPPLPSLPAQGGSAMPDDRERPQLPAGEDVDDDDREWDDPAARDERRAMRDERRKQREAMLDTNKDGVLSPAEKQQRLKPMVERMDANGDGKLTPTELAGAQQRRMQFEDPGLVDTDKNGEISLAELDAAVTARREQMRERWRGRGGRGSADVPRP